MRAGSTLTGQSEVAFFRATDGSVVILLMAILYSTVHWRSLLSLSVLCHEVLGSVYIKGSAYACRCQFAGMCRDKLLHLLGIFERMVYITSQTRLAPVIFLSQSSRCDFKWTLTPSSPIRGRENDYSTHQVGEIL
jgi:hypothetical protein